MYGDDGSFIDVAVRPVGNRRAYQWVFRIGGAHRVEPHDAYGGGGASRSLAAGQNYLDRFRRTVDFLRDFAVEEMTQKAHDILI